MKKVLVIIITLLFTANVYAEEIQLTDYIFVYGKRMLNGYSFITYSDEYEYCGIYYDRVQSNILKPDGTLLYNSGDYTIEYSVISEPKEQFSEDPKYLDYISDYPKYIFPQGMSGETFTILNPFQPYIGKTFWEKKCGLINSAGEPLTPFASSIYNSISSDYYLFSRNDNTKKVGIYNIKTGTEFELKNTFTPNYDIYYYYNSHKNEFAVVNKKENDKFCISFYKDDKLYTTYEQDAYSDNKFNKKEPIFSSDANNFVYEQSKFYRIYPHYFTRTNYINEIENNYVNMDMTTQETSKADKSYFFKSKTINGITYYALFKKTGLFDDKKEYLPIKPNNIKYSQDISNMFDTHLLYNNDLCYYDSGITKLDFGIILGRAYCKATGYNIDEFTSDTKFTDVNNPYCLLLVDNGILTSDTELYINEKEISKKMVSNALSTLAEKYKVLSKWNTVKSISDTDDTCSRELAYSEVYKLYEILKEGSDLPSSDVRPDYGKVLLVSIGSVLFFLIGAVINDRLSHKKTI